MTSPPPLRSARTGDGVTLAWTALGVGPPLIWMPSMGNLVAQWRVPTLRRAYERLAGSFRLILYDGRGTGASDRRVDHAGLGLDGQLRDLAAVVEAVGPEPVALLGYYHSVPAAIAYAAAHPRRVSRLVLFGGALRLRDSMSPQQTQALLSLIDQDWDLFAETAAHTWLGWQAGESGRLIAESFRTAATPTLARALFAEAGRIDVSELASQVHATPRELEVLRLLAEGHSNAEIAARMDISVHTVERHAANLYRKIGARGRADATAYAVRQGLA
ncbi:helix-turn-helix transcriptional regulator [Segeticoccus rhizosphaerae]|jgi:DNA-binding CsgD family transcriptional regulator|uniref:helix-turn-helix transcriptional regulator n=1 Tax=Segeticoccus rhizosphaerae TaxID=1104777 RepID=UPI0010C12C25|nr:MULTISPECIES: alpha/beta fold hydrolase [Intrasporangiaceae]